MAQKHKNISRPVHNYQDIMHLIDQLDPKKQKYWQYCCDGFTAKKLIDNCPEFIKANNASFLIVIAAMYKSKAMLDTLNLPLDSTNNIVAGSNSVTYCVMSNQLQALQFLLQHGANPNAVDKAGNHPLPLAVFLGYKSIVLELLKAGADANATTLTRQDEDMKNVDVTEAHNAMQLALGELHRFIQKPFDYQEEIQDYYMMIELLLANGADPYTINLESGNPYVIAFVGFIEMFTPEMDRLAQQLKEQPTIEISESEFLLIQYMNMFVRLDKIFSRYALKV